MQNRSVVTTVAIAAVLVVILPLLATIAAVLASFGYEASNGAGLGFFGSMGVPHLLMLGWTIVAVLIVAGLVAVVLKDQFQHA